MKKAWKKAEEKDAKTFNASLTPRSGGLWFAKGDSKSDKFLIENKTTEKKSFSISNLLWKKVEKEGLLNQRIPLISLEFLGKSVELIILDKNDFISLLE